MREKTQVERTSRFSRLAGFVRRRRSARRERWRNFFGAIRTFRRSVASLLLLLYLFVLGHLTLFRFYQINPGTNLIPGRTIAHDLGKGGAELIINTLGNVLATMPLGILLPIILPSRVVSALRVALAAFLTSVVIEVAQYWLGRRVADVDDVILNTLGGWFGYGVGLAWRWWFKTRIESYIREAAIGADHRTR